MIAKKFVFLGIVFVFTAAPQISYSSSGEHYKSSKAKSEKPLKPGVSRKDADVVVSVSGMSCGRCKAKLEKKFGSLDYVTAVTASVEEKFVALKLKKGKKLSKEDLRQAIGELGYTVETVKYKPART